MKLYRRKELINDAISYSEFAAELGRSIATRKREPFLLHRSDGARLLVTVRSSRIMLSLAYGRSRYKVSTGCENASGSRMFLGLERDCTTQDGFFVDPRHAMRAVEVFFDARSLSDYVEFQTNLPDPAILEFPIPFPIKRKSERSTVTRKVDVPDALARDMADVCLYIQDSANDSDVDLDFDDAIQCGGLCGGRIDCKKDLYLFTYHHENGRIWEIRETFVGLDGIGSGAFRTITVTVVGGEE